MISRDEIGRIARLAKLSLTSDEEARLAAQLLRILGYVDLLRGIDAEAPSDVDSDLEALPSARADDPRPGLTRDEVMALAPATDGETFLVPPVLEGGEPA